MTPIIQEPGFTIYQLPGNSGADAAMDMFTDVMFGKGWEE